MDIFQKRLFCISLSDKLRRFLDTSIDVYIAKSSGRIHITANIDLIRFYSSVTQIVWQQHFFHDFWFWGNYTYDFYRCLELRLCQQKGCQYDYFLFVKYLSQCKTKLFSFLKKNLG